MNLVKKIFYGALSILAFVFLLTNNANADTVRITTETLNLREEPSTNSDIVAQISIGEECDVISEEGDWYEVEYGEYTGYISKEYAELVDGSTNTSNETSDNTNTVDENNSGDNTGDNTGDNSNSENNTDNNSGTNTENDNNEVDASNETNTNNSGNQTSTSTTVTGRITQNTTIKIVPLINSTTIENINANDEVTVIAQINNWVYIQTDEVSGWVISSSISIGNNTNSNDNNNDNQDSTNNNSDNNTGDNGDSNNNADDTTDDTEFETRTMYTQDYVNIRREPSTTAEIIMTVAENTALEVIGEDGDWYRVNTSEGEAYVIKSALANERIQVTNRGSVDRGSSNNIEENSNKDTSSSSENTNNNSGVTGSEIVAYAKKFLGVPYVYGGASSSGFDCSGFTMYVFDHFGISMGHGAQMQSRLGEAVEANKNSKTSLLENLEVGDLVFFLDYETMDEIGHCGIYIGNGDFIHASSGSGYCVKINSLLPGEYYNTRYCAARRVL